MTDTQTRGFSGVRDSAGISAIGALEMARRIADGATTAVELVECHIARIERADALNAVVSRRFEAAVAEAAAADAFSADQRRHRPLHGVPITVKDCFAVEGLGMTLGNPQRSSGSPPPAKRDARVVQRLRDAGAIVLAKTNVPQLMIYNECVNPVAGRTLNPWDPKRTPGGSSGGAAAILAAGGAALELGSDSGGSARVPASFCGVHTLMPTPGMISRAGMADGIPGMAHLVPVISPMARRVEDLLVAANVLAERWDHRSDWLRSPRPEAVANLRIAVWPSDDAFPPSPAIARAIEFAKRALVYRGATVVEFDPPSLSELLRCFVSLWTADGSRTIRGRVHGVAADPHIRRMIMLSRLPGIARAIHLWMLKKSGDQQTAELINAAREMSVAGYWQLVGKLRDLRAGYLRDWADADVDAIICPAYGLPALLHGQALDLLPASSYAVWVNLFGLPAGVVSVSHVRAGEESRRTPDTPVAKQAVETETDSAGLPVGIQVVARPQCEQAIATVMLAVEAAVPDDDNPALHGRVDLLPDD